MNKVLLAISLGLNVLFLHLAFFVKKPVPPKTNLIDAIGLPFFPDEAYSRYYIDGENDSDFMITTSSRITDDFDHDLCNNCTSKSKIIGNSEVLIWSNPGQENPISITVVPRRDYGIVYSFQIDQLDQKTHRVKEFDKKEADWWLTDIASW